MYKLILIPLLFLTFYVPVPLPLLGGWYIPNLPALILALFFIRSVWNNLPWISLCLGALALYCAANAIFAYGIVTPGVERLKGSLQLLYFVGVALVLGNSTLFSDRVFRKRFGYVLIGVGFVMILGAFLENRTGLGMISDRFRLALYGGGSFYVNDTRDILIADAIRPKLFASEPSVAAMGTCICLTLGAMVANNFIMILASALGCLVTAQVFGSPIPAAFAITLLAGGLPAHLAARRNWPPQKLLWRQIGFVVMALVVLGVAFFAFDTLRERINLIVSGQDRSSYLRLLHVGVLALQAMQMNFLFGVGIGGEVEMGNQLWVEGAEHLNSNAMINNPVWAIGLFGGFTGICVAGWALWRILRPLAYHLRFAFGLFVLSVMFSGGSIVNTSAWVTGAVLFAAYRAVTTEVKSGVRAPMLPARVRQPTKQADARAIGGGS